MKYIIIALALCFTLSPVEAASKSANTHSMKSKKSKAHKPPKARSHARTRAN
jgi:hypothetical protein